MTDRVAAPMLLVLLVVVACTGTQDVDMSPSSTFSPAPPGSPSPSPPANRSPSAPPSPSTSPSPSPSASGSPSVATSAQAVALVLASEPYFAGVTPLSPDLIGGCCWYQVAPSVNPPGFEVVVTIGWGDCMAGCIDRHTWTYHVSQEGEVTLGGETGEDPPPDVVPGPGTGPGSVTVHLLAGPSCPAETQPPDPNCAPRPVGNAEVVVRDHLGVELARGTSGADGSVAMELPAGVYIVEVLPTEGLMATPEPVAFSVAPGGFAVLFLAYDTGIR